MSGPTIALCGGLVGHGLDPFWIADELTADGADVIVADDLCADPSSIKELAGGDRDRRLVLAICPAGPSNDEIKSQARRAGLDPGTGAIRVDLVRATAYGDPEDAGARAIATLLASTAEIDARPASPQGAFRLALPRGTVSRRSLLSMARTSYVPVAEVGRDGCIGSAACGLCVEACPVHAIEPSFRVPTVDKDRCIGCAACVTACPVGDAVRLPGADLVGFEAHLRAVRDTDAAVGLLIACRGAPPIPPERLPGAWLLVEVPCLSIVTSGWALGALGTGARTVAFSGCGDACGAGAPTRVAPRLSFARDCLAAMGVIDPGARIRLMLPPNDDDGDTVAAPGELPPLNLAPEPGLRLREPAATASILAGAVDGAEAIRSEGSPLGILTVRVDDCTMCGLCAKVCPTGAFRFEEGPLAAALDLDRDRCVACGHCVAICPEHVIEVDRGVDPARSDRAWEAVKRSAMEWCRRCGQPVASSAMLERIRAMLPDDPMVMTTVEELCLDCRGR